MVYPCDTTQTDVHLNIWQRHYLGIASRNTRELAIIDCKDPFDFFFQDYTDERGRLHVCPHKKKKKFPWKRWCVANSILGKKREWEAQRGNKKMERAEDLIKTWGIPLMGGSYISTIHPASAEWNSHTVRLSGKNAEIKSSPSCSHPAGSTLYRCLLPTRDSLRFFPPALAMPRGFPWPAAPQRSSWFTMIHSLTAGQTVSTVCMIQQSI